jgi:hypothetical protein
MRASPARQGVTHVSTITIFSDDDNQSSPRKEILEVSIQEERKNGCESMGHLCTLLGTGRADCWSLYAFIHSHIG